MELYYTKLQRPTLHPGYFIACRLMGLDDPATKQAAIQLAYSEHWWNLNISTPFSSYNTEFKTNAHDTATLLVTAEGPARKAVSNIKLKYPRVHLPVKLVRNGSVIALETPFTTWTVNCWETGYGLHIEWPEEFNINGDVALPLADNATIIIPVHYDVSFIVENMNAESEIYSFLEKHGLEEDYYIADRPEEKVAIVLKAVIKEVS